MRLFVAAWPAPTIVEILRQLPRPRVPGLRWTTEAQWHVTLAFLGETENPAGAIDALEVVAHDLVEIVAALGPSTSHFDRKVLYIPVHGVDAVARAVQEKLLPGRPHAEFRGHITLARARNRVRLDSCLGIPIDGSWRVDSLALVASDTQPDGARYTTISTACLRSRT